MVLNAVTGTEYVAHLGPDGAAGAGVATRDGTPVGVRAPAPLPAARLDRVQLRPRAARAQARAMVNLLPRIRDIRRIGSSALDLCNVGEGAVDAYVEEGVNYWDHAAGALVARIAGPAPS